MWVDVGRERGMGDWLGVRVCVGLWRMLVWVGVFELLRMGVWGRWRTGLVDQGVDARDCAGSGVGVWLGWRVMVSLSIVCTL